MSRILHVPSLVQLFLYLIGLQHCGTGPQTIDHCIMGYRNLERKAKAY
jgi:hypothetical protein